MIIGSPKILSIGANLKLTTNSELNCTLDFNFLLSSPLLIRTWTLNEMQATTMFRIKLLLSPRPWDIIATEYVLFQRLGKNYQPKRKICIILINLLQWDPANRKILVVLNNWIWSNSLCNFFYASLL